MNLAKRMLLLLFVFLLLYTGLSVSRYARGATSIVLPLPVKLNPPPVIYGDEFGNALAMDGDYLAVGAWRTNVGSEKQEGVVYLFKRDPTDPLTFHLLKTLTAGDGRAYLGFGVNVAIHGDTLAVGAIYDDPDGHFDAGSIYVFQRNHGGADAWGEVAKLYDANYDDEYSEHGYMGESLAVYGDRILAGAPRQRGRVFVYYRHQGGTDQWGEEQVFTAPNYWEGGSFGSAVALDGQHLVIGGSGASMVPGKYNREGAAFVYEHDGTNWVLQQKLAIADEDPDTPYANHSDFGGVLALHGDTLYVGAAHMVFGDQHTVGEVFVYQLNDSDHWGLIASLTAPDRAQSDYFGRALYATDEGLFVSSKRGENGTVYFFRNAASAQVAGTRALENLHTWAYRYSFSTTENVKGIDFGSALAGNGSALVIAARTYNNGAGGIFSYPLAELVAVDPNATPTDPATAEPIPTNTAEPGPSGTHALLLPVVANGPAQQLPQPGATTGVLANEGILAGPSGVRLGAVTGALTDTVAVTMVTATAPNVPLPNGVGARGDYVRISGERTVLVDMQTPFVVSVEVPPGADTSHLALAHLQSAADLLDTEAEGDLWSYLPGAYDAAHNLFLAKLPFLRAGGATFVLVEHPDMISPLNGQATQAAAAALAPFDAFCMTADFPQPDDCTATLETDVETFLNGVFQVMTTKYGYPEKLRLLDSGATFIVTESYSVTAATATYSVFLLHNSFEPCKGLLGFYNPESGFLGLCLEADEVLGDVKKDVLTHEFFHAIQYTYPEVLWDHVLERDELWIIEGMAQAAMESYDATTMARNFYYGEDNLHKVDIALTAGKPLDGVPDEYLAQDFWVYIGQSKADGMEYLRPLLEIGGVKTKGVADVLQVTYNNSFADLYWGWVKNQVIENTYDLGGGPGELCLLTEEALTGGQAEAFPAGWIIYPFDEEYRMVPPLTAKVVEIQVPHTKSSLFVMTGYEECDGITDPDAMSACLLEAQQHMRVKIYEEGESLCQLHDLPGVTTPREDMRHLSPIQQGKRYFVVVANVDTEEEHGFALLLE